MWRQHTSITHILSNTHTHITVLRRSGSNANRSHQASKWSKEEERKWRRNKGREEWDVATYLVGDVSPPWLYLSSVGRVGSQSVYIYTYAHTVVYYLLIGSCPGELRSTMNRNHMTSTRMLLGKPPTIAYRPERLTWLVSLHRSVKIPPTGPPNTLGGTVISFMCSPSPSTFSSLHSLLPHHRIGDPNLRCHERQTPSRFVGVFFFKKRIKKLAKWCHCY